MLVQLHILVSFSTLIVYKCVIIGCSVYYLDMLHHRAIEDVSSLVWLAKWCKIHKVYINSHSMLLLLFTNIFIHIQQLSFYSRNIFIHI